VEAVPAQTVVRLIRVYGQGSTSPALVETGSGELFVMKFSAAGPGVRTLLTEFVATALAGQLGLRVPPTRALYLPPHFPWQIGTDEFDDLVQRSAGWNLGMGYIAQARDLSAGDLDGLPPAFATRLALSDRLLHNVDRTRENPNILVDPAGRFWAIDHGACLFLGRVLGDRQPFVFELPAGHFLADNSRIAAAPAEPANPLERDVIRPLIEAAPASWFGGIELSRAALAARLSSYVGAFHAASGGRP
jgi:hypothetical protein